MDSNFALRPMEALADAAENGDDEGEDDRGAEDDGEGEGDRGAEDEGDRGAEDEGDRPVDDDSDDSDLDDEVTEHGGEGEGDHVDDHGDRSTEDGSDGDDDDEASDFDDATTLVLGATPPQLSSDDEKNNMELQSTDNESRSPWEKTGVTKANKLLKRKMLKEGKSWPPSPRHCPLERAQSSDDEDDGTPNLPSSSTGVYAMASKETDENYVTPGKRLPSSRLDGSTEKTLRTDKGKVMMHGTGATGVSWLALVVLVDEWWTKKYSQFLKLLNSFK